MVEVNLFQKKMMQILEFKNPCLADYMLVKNYFLTLLQRRIPLCPVFRRSSTIKSKLLLFRDSLQSDLKSNKIFAKFFLNGLYNNQL